MLSVLSIVVSAWLWPVVAVAPRLLSASAVAVSIPAGEVWAFARGPPLIFGNITVSGTLLCQSPMDTADVSVPVRVTVEAVNVEAGGVFRCAGGDALDEARPLPLTAPPVRLTFAGDYPGINVQPVSETGGFVILL